MTTNRTFREKNNYLVVSRAENRSRPRLQICQVHFGNPLNVIVRQIKAQQVGSLDK